MPYSEGTVYSEVDADADELDLRCWFGIYKPTEAVKDAITETVTETVLEAVVYVVKVLEASLRFGPTFGRLSLLRQCLTLDRWPEATL